MNIKNIIKTLMNSKDKKVNKPKILYHEVMGGAAVTESDIMRVVENGLQADYSNWEAIDELVPKRPQGNFFWGEEFKRKESPFIVSVKIGDLDTSKLFAFPRQAAFIAYEIINGYESNYEIGCREALKQIEAIPYDEYRCEFSAEWIYTENIPPSIINSNL